MYVDICADWEVLGSQFPENDQGDYLMQTTSKAADKTVDRTGPAKLSEKLAEKRRALGRGLESLLPGPRVVPASPADPPAAPTLSQSTRKDGAADGASSQFSVLSSQEISQNPTPREALEGSVVRGTVSELQAVAAGRTADGEAVYRLAGDEIDHNPDTRGRAW